LGEICSYIVSVKVYLFITTFRPSISLFHSVFRPFVFFFSFHILDISLLVKKQQMRNANVEKKKKKEKETNTKTQILEIVSGRVQRAATSEALCVRQISVLLPKTSILQLQMQ